MTCRIVPLLCCCALFSPLAAAVASAAEAEPVPAPPAASPPAASPPAPAAPAAPPLAGSPPAAAPRAPAAPSLAAAPPAAAPAEPAGPTDHQRLIGRFGVGWYGVSEIPLATGTTSGTSDDYRLGGFGLESVSAPALGARYWVSELVGLDFALGLHFSGGTTVLDDGTEKITTREKRRRALMIHAGVPLALASGKHVSFLVTPAIDLGFAGARFEPQETLDDPPPSVDLSGFRFDLGARVGAEIYFGFIGLPELSLEGGVGAFLTNQSVEAVAGDQRASSSSTRINTSLVNDPWDFFRGAVAARYYF